MKQEISFSRFRDMPLERIENLSAGEMRKLLGMLHGEAQRGVCGRPKQQRGKGKTIKKFNNKARFKQYIRQRIRAIVSASIDRVYQSMADRPEEQRERLQRAKLKFKKPSLCLKRKLDNFKENVDSMLESATHDELNCPICLEMLVSPALTTCGHVFCLQCLDESMLFGHNCPNCRENIKGCEPVVCSTLAKLITERARMKLEEWTRYEERLVKFEEWRRDRVPSFETLQSGSLIDVRDTESIWCQGTVLEVQWRVEEGRRVAVSVLVHYNRWNKLYNEVIQLPSIRIASFQCFSGRIDIPRYNLADEDENMRGSVVSGPARPEGIAIDYVHLLYSDDADEIEESEEDDQQDEEQEEEESVSEQEQRQQNDGQEQGREGVSQSVEQARQSNSNSNLLSPEHQLYRRFMESLQRRNFTESVNLNPRIIFRARISHTHSQPNTITIVDSSPEQQALPQSEPQESEPFKFEESVNEVFPPLSESPMNGGQFGQFSRQGFAHLEFSSSEQQQQQQQQQQPRFRQVKSGQQ